MDSKLIAIAGPLEGAFFLLAPEQEVTIGRDPSNVLAIDDPEIAGRHCTIHGDAASFRIRDLESGQPTFVDGLPVRERALHHGTEIRLGRSLFLFLAGAEAPASRAETLRADTRIERSMVGESPAMSHVYRFIAKVAPTDSTVLVRGESGTGKELAVRAMHQSSSRAAHPFMAINCAALAPNLLESELFGHERGAFTGAVCQKKGKLELANGGTVFLDEVGELDPVLQTKLLRALQEREFERVGGTQLVKVNIRLIAATNRDLEEAVDAGKFRRDLYYRLNVISVRIPALRERREDIPLLANYFISRYCRDAHRRVLGLSAQARACLMSYDWPGNVRELENAIQHAIVLGTSELILPEDLPETLLETDSAAAANGGRYQEGIREAKRQLILKAIEQAGGNYTEAARWLGVHVNYLHRLVRNMNLRTVICKNGPAA